MLRSMTAYGRGVVDQPGAHYAVEIQSVNRKHLEIQTHLPRILSFIENDVRSTVSEHISRGQISIRVQASFHDKAPYKVVPNFALAEQIKKGWDEIGEKLGIKGFSLEFLLSSPDIVSIEMTSEDEEGVKSDLLNALKLALEALITMKEREGVALVADFQQRLETIESGITMIMTKSLEHPEKWRKKIEERLSEIGKSLELDERVAREVALLAEKVDITEECVRFQSHIAQFREFVMKRGVFGKTLEFILQELGREINTIGSKSQDVEISRTVIVVKSELEKMREQVQNVE